MSSPTPDWSFARRPGWLLSHVFVALCVVAMLVAANWQWNRHHERADLNAVVAARADAAPVSLAEALAGTGAGVASLSEVGDAVAYTHVEVSITWLDPAFVRVANRSNNGEAGDWMVGLAETADGQLLFVNRGFLPRIVDPDPVAGDDLVGWLRASERGSWLSADDSGEGRAPLLDLDALAARAEAAGYDATAVGESEGDETGTWSNVVPVWLQLESPTTEGYPVPVPLPASDGGSHLSYVVQWLIFATLTSIAYVMTLRKIASGGWRRAD